MFSIIARNKITGRKSCVDALVILSPTLVKNQLNNGLTTISTIGRNILWITIQHRSYLIGQHRFLLLFIQQKFITTLNCHISSRSQSQGSANEFQVPRLFIFIKLHRAFRSFRDLRDEPITLNALCNNKNFGQCQ